ncbi:hypothetical protein EDM22_00210 [Agromyces tardus]|uniref:Uncharacterized protein n=1 Tax=Agromyces tardus TaxID=2583849 RepID=A0A3M8ANV7_9MICO|nr:hypothetical protein [Agromyces tardus]RNB52185.1 hypothetical protein EDM22_00210 [Agromyces tardus]
MAVTPKKAYEVFGVSRDVLPDSYVDRGSLDERLGSLLQRQNHIAIRGASKSGKSWLRQMVAPDAVVIQCRLGKTVEDLYREALGMLGITLEVRRTAGDSFSGHVESSVGFGQALIMKVSGKLGLGYTRHAQSESVPVRQDVSDISFIAELLVESGRRLVIEDVHYLSHAERRRLSFDLKALWDLGLFVIIIGVWKEQSLIDLNPDLSGRVKEMSVTWSDEDLEKIIAKGTKALNVALAPLIIDSLVRASYGNAGLLQALTLELLDEAGIDERPEQTRDLVDHRLFEAAAMQHAENLNVLYQNFAKRVSSGIRRRKNSTGIYAHAMAVILEESDESLMRGLPLKEIHAKAHEREPRILLPNLRTALSKIEALQTDDEGRGLVLSYDEGREAVYVVDLQLLLYRRYSTVAWPWDDIVAETEGSQSAFELDAME